VAQQRRRVETMAEKSKRLVSPTASSGGVPTAPPKYDPDQFVEQESMPYRQLQEAPKRRRSPTRLAAAAAAAPIGQPVSMSRAQVPQYTQAQMQAFHAQEQQRRMTEAQGMQRQMQSPPGAPLQQAPAASRQGMAALNSFTGAAAGPQAPPPAPIPPDPEVHVSASEMLPVSKLSSWDREVLEMADQLDPSQLVMDGFMLTELEIHPALSITVKSLKKSDRTEIAKDVNEFRRGIEVTKDLPDLDNPGQTKKVLETIVPFPEEIHEFAQLRRLSQGIVGVNGAAYPDHWSQRAGLLEGLATPVYDAMLREFFKFLDAVGTMFPDRPTQEKMEELKANLGKAQAPH